MLNNVRLLALVSFLGVLDSLYTLKISRSEGVCLLGDGCNAVLNVDVHFLGYSPSEYGVAYYLIFFVYSILRLLKPNLKLSRLSIAWLSLTAWVGVFVSGMLTGLQVFLVKELCFFCLFSVLLTICIILLNPARLAVSGNQKSGDLVLASVLLALLATVGVYLNQPPDRVEIDTSSGFSIGPVDAEYHVVCFIDLRCQHCYDKLGSLKKLVSEREQDLQLTIMNYPVGVHPLSGVSAVFSGLCQSPSQFWAFYEKLSNEKVLNRVVLERCAIACGLSDIWSRERMKISKERILESREEGQRLKIKAVPAIFVNGFRDDSLSFLSLESES